MLKPYKKGVLLQVHVQPRAKKEEIVGLYGEALKIRLTAPPVEGKANEALRKFLARVLKIPKSAVKIVSGTSSRQKGVYLEGLDRETACKRLGLK